MTDRRLWVALGLPPVAWFTAQNLGYFFVSWTCARQGGELALHAIALGGTGVCAFGGWLAVAVLRQVGAGGPDEKDDADERTRFLARLALAGAIVLGLIVLAQWLAVLILEPCLPMPRSPFTPDA